MVKKVVRYALIVLFIGMIVIQFISRPETVAQPLNPQNDMISLLGVDDEMKDLLQHNCYDCHSNQPVYPWYSKIAPVSWWTNEHMEHGREELNFSNWGEYSKRRKDHKLEEMVEEVEGGAMPLPSYTWIHGKLNNEEKELLKNWVNTERAKLAGEGN